MRQSAQFSERAQEQMIAHWERQRAESGQALGYYGCHRRVRKARGRAGDQVCKCGKKAAHWAQIHGTDPTDPASYEAMCISCHRRYDRIRQKQIATLGAEGRTAAAKLAWSRRSPEQRREIMRKAWATRRQNAGGTHVVAADPALDGD